MGWDECGRHMMWCHGAHRAPGSSSAQLQKSTAIDYKEKQPSGESLNDCKHKVVL